MIYQYFAVPGSISSVQMRGEFVEAVQAVNSRQPAGVPSALQNRGGPFFEAGRSLVEQLLREGGVEGCAVDFSRLDRVEQRSDPLIRPQQGGERGGPVV